MAAGICRQARVIEAARGELTEPDVEAQSEVVTFADLKIRTKDKRLVPFTPNPVQEMYLDMLQREHPPFRWREGIYDLRGIREDILKARQQGLSTLWLALYFCDTINTPLTQSVIVAHDAPTTEKLFKVIHRFYEHLPEEKKRPKKYSSKREIEFSDIDSIISVGTAGGSGVGRGGTINNAHFSERAFWRDGDEIEAGLLEAIPADGNATRETTANGLNEYYEERQRAENGESNFAPRFFGWFLEPQYRLDPGPDFARTEEEETLAAAYNLDDEQLAWRRAKKRDLKDKFPQEYPSNAREAFLTSGNPYFDRDILTELSDVLSSSEFDPLPMSEVKAALPSEYVKLRQNIAGLQVWELPIPGRTYVIGADTAEGINDHGDHDYDSADVIDLETGTQVAHLHGRWDTNEYGVMLAQLGWWYNTALVAPERNNHGHAVINAMLHVALYPEAKQNQCSGVYFHQEYDERKKPKARRPGWPTTTKTKYFALDGLAASLIDSEIHIRSRQTIAELLTFVKLPGNRAGGEGKSFDDRVISLSIADAMCKLRPEKPAETPRSTVIKKTYFN